MRHLFNVVFIFAALSLVGCSTTQQTHHKSNTNITQARDSYEAYVLTYYPIAVEQMHRHNIPASITLAQGLLESGAGKSELTRKSNNHFGIKAHNWTGRTTSTMDNGKMCKFRVYDSARDSYEDHSQFLLKPRYAALFKLSPTDYKGWARGLKKAGYAEDPAYPQKLISLIERYRLYEYDNYSKGDVSPLLHSNNSNGGFSGSRPIYTSGGLYYVVANTGDTFQSLSKEMGVSRRKLIKYNDLYKDYNIKAGDVIYLEKKRKKANKEYKFHTTGNGESLYSISQKYGVRLKNLYNMNPEYKNYTTLKVGDVVILR